MAVAELSLRALEERVERLDAKARVSPGQLGLDFSTPAAPPPKPKPAAAAGKGPGGGEKCGAGWIDPKKECRKNGPSGTAPDGRGLNGGASGAKVPQVTGGLQAKPMTLNTGGDSEFDVYEEEKANKGGVKFIRGNRGANPYYGYFFRDRAAAAHWYAKDVASSDADDEVGSDKRRTAEWKAEYKAVYQDYRNVLRDVSDRELLETVQAFASSNKSSRGGTFVDVRIGGNKHSRPIREGTFGSAKQKPETEAEPVLTNPDRYDPGLAPKAKPSGINAQEVTTSTGQAQLARQQRKAAQEAGDQKAAEAWRQQERAAERDRLQNALSRGQQNQASLFGVTEYDETMPLFRQRRDSVDPVAQLCGSILQEQLPGAQVLDWSRQPRGITAGRAVSEGLIYRFRLDAESIGYRPAWEGIDERKWELRSEGFLAARDPSARLDYRRGLKFQQKTTKRQCSKGYGCGSACISLSKECRVQPKSAISKVRLRQLQALAQEGDQKAATQAQELQMQREAKAQSLQKGRQTARLEKMLQDPRVAEMVRTGKVPEAAAGDAKPGQVRDIKPSEVEVDAERFQYKIGSSASGEVGSLSGVQRWDPNLAGVISVWQDPEDGKTYVVNGHNRLALAKRLGAEEVTVRYLKAGSAQEARAIGAMQNIAEGAGTEIDAGKFFRDSGLKTIEEVKAKGLPLKSGKAEKGLALAQLPDEMFNDVVQGNLRVRRAAVIGGSGLDQDKQREVYKVLKARPSMTDETLQEYVEHLAVSSRQTQTEIDLFGSSEKSVDTGLARAELANGLKKALGREARLLGAVSRSAQAVELLEQKGGNTINVEQSQQQAGEASSVLRFFDQLKSVSGPVAAALDQAAARVTAGENRNKVARELRQQVVQAMEEELKRLGLRQEAPPVDELTMNLFDSADRFDSLEARIDAARRKCQTGYACGSSCISADKDCRSEGKATTGKERLKRLEQVAQGGATGRGIGRLKGGAAAAKVEQIKASRSEQAAQLRQERAQRRPAGGALVPTGGTGPAVTPEVVQPGSSTGRPGSIASTMREALNAMKAADARQMGMVAEQLFETDWLLERRGRYRGMSKDQAREQYKAEFMQKLHKEASSPEAAARKAEMGRKAAEAGSVSGAMRSLLEQMKASDDRLNDLTRQAIDLRVGAEEQFGGESDEPGLGGSSNRRRLGRGRRRDAVDDRFEGLITRLSALQTRPDAARLDCLRGRLATSRLLSLGAGHLDAPGFHASPEIFLGAGRLSSRRIRLSGSLRQDHRIGEATHANGQRSDKGTGEGAGQPCGDTFISPKYTCRIGLNTGTSPDLNVHLEGDGERVDDIKRAIMFYTNTPNRIKDVQARIAIQAGWTVSVHGYSQDERLSRLALDRVVLNEIREKAELLENYIEKAPKYEGDVHRGVFFGSSRDAENFIEDLQNNVSASVDSWSASRPVAEVFSGINEPRSWQRAAVVLTQKNKHGASIKRYSAIPEEDEVLQPSGLRYQVLSITERVEGSLARPLTIYEVEVEAVEHRSMQRKTVLDSFLARLDALEARMDRRCKRPDGTYYGTSGECRKGKLAGAVRSLGQRIKGAGRRLLGRGAKVSEADAMAAAERIQQMAAARKKEEADRQAKEKAREEELLSRGPQKWGVKQVEKEEVRGSGDKGVVWHESRYEVQLEEPLRLPSRPGKEPRLVDKLSFQVAVDEANAKPIARKLGEQGIALSNGQVNNALELAWLTGAGGGEAFMGADRMELPKNVARRFAMEVSKQVKGLVSNMEEGQIVLCKAHQDDGYGDKRRSLYERAGFTFIDGTGIAVVRNGRLSRIEGARGDRLDAGDVIDLDGLILALLTLGGDDRFDALITRLRQDDFPGPTNRNDSREERIWRFMHAMAGAR